MKNYYALFTLSVQDIFLNKKNIFILLVLCILVLVLIPLYAHTFLCSSQSDYRVNKHCIISSAFYNRDYISVKNQFCLGRKSSELLSIINAERHSQIVNDLNDEAMIFTPVCL
jgi:hypothetical protein